MGGIMIRALLNDCLLGRVLFPQLLFVRGGAFVAKYKRRSVLVCTSLAGDCRGGRKDKLREEAHLIELCRIRSEDAPATVRTNPQRSNPKAQLLPASRLCDYHRKGMP